MGSEEIGALAESLKIFQKYKVNLLHIESRSSTRLPGYEFMVELDQQKGEVAGALEEIKNASRYCQIITCPSSPTPPLPSSARRSGLPPWAPRTSTLRSW